MNLIKISYIFNMKEIIEKNINDYPEAISLEGTEEIVKQMKNKVCQIYIENVIKGTGFLCKIPLIIIYYQY